MGSKKLELKYRFIQTARYQFYSRLTKTKASVPGIIDEVMKDGALVWCPKEKKDITSEVLATWLGARIQEDFMEAPVELLRKVLNELPVTRMPRKYLAKYGKVPYKEHCPPPGGRDTPEWSVEQLRAFYRLKTVCKIRECLRCEHSFKTDTLFERLCEKCRELTFKGLHRVVLPA